MELISQMKDYYCELEMESRRRFRFLTGFNRNSQRMLLNKIQRAVDIIATTLPGISTQPINCTQHQVSLPLLFN